MSKGDKLLNREQLGAVTTDDRQTGLLFTKAHDLFAQAMGLAQQNERHFTDIGHRDAPFFRKWVIRCRRQQKLLGEQWFDDEMPFVDRQSQDAHIQAPIQATLDRVRREVFVHGDHRLREPAYDSFEQWRKQVGRHRWGLPRS